MNTKTKAQRINKRQDAIWDKAKRAQAETAAAAPEAPQDERIINASAKAIGPVHLPSQREIEQDKPAHTPGPWKVVEAAGEVTVFDNGAPRLIARCGKWFRADDQANAALIAAAPELLEALKHAQSYVSMSQREDAAEDLQRMNLAIAKAEGSDQ